MAPKKAPGVTDRINSASHLYALAHGEDCIGDMACFLCGAPCDGSIPRTDYAKPGSFTGWSTVASPGSTGVCKGCALAFRDSAEITMIDGEARAPTRSAIRTYSWVVTRGSAIAASKAHIDELRAICLSPPEPPYMVVLSESGQTHQIYRGVVGRSRDIATVCLECVPIVYRPADLAAALGVAGKLAAALGKPVLRLLPLEPTRSFRVFERYSDADALIREWNRVGPTPLGRLASWLCPNMETCRLEYPSDVD